MLALLRCDVCGNIVQPLHQTKVPVMCCGKKMEPMTDNTQEAAVEKHIPVVNKIEGGYHVIVGDVEHPMMDEHFIQWIQLYTEDSVITKMLKPGEKPEAEFLCEADEVTAKAYCNLHGNWKNEI